MEHLPELLDAAAALPARPGHDELRRLGAQLQALAPLVEAADAAKARTEQRLMLAEHPSGAAAALRFYEPGYVSTVHDHAWTVIVGLEGNGTLERWQAAPTGARFAGAVPTRAGSVGVIDGNELHRQVAGASGALELVLIGDLASAVSRTDHDPAPDDVAASGLFGAFIDAWARADAKALEPLYAENVFADIHVPRWRVQLEGRTKLLDMIAREEFPPGYRLEQWTARATADGFVVELEGHFDHGDQAGMAQMVLLTRTRDARIAEHTIYCTGIWDQATMDGLVHSGGLLRP